MFVSLQLSALVRNFEKEQTLYLHVQPLVLAHLSTFNYGSSRGRAFPCIPILDTFALLFYVHTSFSSFRLSPSSPFSPKSSSRPNLPPPSNFLRLFLSAFLPLLPAHSFLPFIRHSTRLPPTTPPRAHIRSLPFSRCPPLPPCPLPFASQPTRQATSMSATARFQAVEGNWLCPAARRDGHLRTHPLATTPAGPREIRLWLRLKRRGENSGAGYN